MTGPDDRVVVSEYGTGLLRTTIMTDAEDGYLWLRAPGELAPAPFAPVQEGLLPALSAISPDGCRLVVGQPAEEGRLYRVGGSESVAAILLREGPSAQLEPPLRGMGAALRELHALEPDDQGPAAPARALQRLDTWLAGRSPSAHAAQAERHLRAHLGPERWGRLRSWSADLLASDDVVVAHGAPGLGSLVAEGEGSAGLLVGEDICAAPSRFDLAWVFGELVEFRWHFRGNDPVWQQLLDAVTAGYGEDLGTWWSSGAALRIALHLHDYTAYVDLNFAELQHYAPFLTFLIDL